MTLLSIIVGEVSSARFKNHRRLRKAQLSRDRNLPLSFLMRPSMNLCVIDDEKQIFEAIFKFESWIQLFACSRIITTRFRCLKSCVHAWMRAMVIHCRLRIQGTRRGEQMGQMKTEMPSFAFGNFANLIDIVPTCVRRNVNNLFRCNKSIDSLKTLLNCRKFIDDRLPGICLQQTRLIYPFN